mmetsp:Transcript_7840/g.15576  ORF Transcript_7840/g.15576 Transcript_7840/m.15576 type:complete len:351 (+) Transcript_7840:382-1434(+)|eukprot:CAMPEP_0171494412 /NCGR_PEP_ID=MMETSP0958-20121227/5532_1 /TAXON_ID=87120 /ORGANISM="Aurantiochytrium limacinum, Strain ATCCMYA-1381" /LENGTH=350 /DNA_ID=CAMNT_0012028201 /DNA_START=412 /DNA_END=1464 /DNA_ORIENTATION=+
MAEVLFQWNGRNVNLKLARSVVRHLAENHGRLAEVGPTQGLRDILLWLQSAHPEDPNFRALEARYANNADYITVKEFLCSFDYETMKRTFPKQSGSLWMATRGVLRKLTAAAETNNSAPPQPPTPPQASAPEDDAVSVKYEYFPQSSAQYIKEGADDVAFETLMLLSNPHQLTQEDAMQLVQAHQALSTVLGDLELLLRNFGGNAVAQFASGGGNGGGSAGGDGTTGSPGSTPPGSPHDFYPSSPGGSSSSGTDGGFSSSSGGSVKGAYTWYASFLASKGETISLEQKLANLSISSALKHGSNILANKTSAAAAAAAELNAKTPAQTAIHQSETHISIQDTMSRSGFDRR